MRVCDRLSVGVQSNAAAQPGMQATRSANAALGGVQNSFQFPSASGVPAALRSGLDEAIIVRAFAEGRELTLKQAIEQAMSDPRRV